MHAARLDVLVNKTAAGDGLDAYDPEGAPSSYSAAMTTGLGRPSGFGLRLAGSGLQRVEVLPHAGALDAVGDLRTGMRQVRSGHVREHTLAHR